MKQHVALRSMMLDWIIRSLAGVLLALFSNSALAQNSMIGDGFGGRLWYRPTNYGVGSYSAFSLCYSDPCDSSSNQLCGWGSDYLGELGNGVGNNCSDVPVAIPGMNNVRYVSAGYFVSAIKNDGTGWIWNNSSPSPTQVLVDCRFVDASAYGVSFVKNDGTVWSIGDNASGQFGDGTNVSNINTAVQMAGVSNAVRVACGFSTNYVLLANGTVLAVGSSWNGLLGNPSFLDTVFSAIGIPGLSDIVDIKAHSNAVAALDSNGDVYCWGTGGSTGDGDFVNDTLPEQVPGLSNVVAISGCTDGTHFLALDAARNCFAWSAGGPPFGVSALDPPQLVGTDVIDIMAGEFMAYMVKADGTLWAAGFSAPWSCSIWLDLPNLDSLGNAIARSEFTQLDPSLVPSACAVVGSVALPYKDCDNVNGALLTSHFGGQAPYQYDIGNGPQSSPLFTGLAEGTYTLTVTDANGCATVIETVLELTDLSTVLPDSLCEGLATCSAGSIFIPSAFSPDVSGKNDQHCVQGTECITSMTFGVYDRWGTKVYESTDPKACWDGTDNGQALDPAVFVYHLIATLTNGETVERQGNITLVR